jgi:nitroreductase
MEFKNSAIDLIKIRKSIRSYGNDELKDEVKKNIVDIIKKDHKTIFGCKKRFEFVDASNLEPDEIKNLGTYGMITGPKYFIVGVIKKNNKDFCLVDFGYVFEKIILHMTDLGLGTCWLGGTFNKKGFSNKATLEKDEVIPGISPVGIISKKRHLKSSMIRTFAGSKKRKKWDKLFFNDSFSSPLEEYDSGSYKVPLEMVRQGPSASNLQPWRIIKEKNKNNFHFFIKRSKFYPRRAIYLNLQYIDLGIALSHFELSVLELGIKGEWEEVDGISDNKKYKIPPNIEYVVSWSGA